MTKAVIFDMDGVIVDSIPIWVEAEFLFLGSRPVHPPLDFKAYMEEIRYPRYTGELKREFKLKGTVKDLREEKFKLIVDLYEKKKLKLIPGFRNLIKLLNKHKIKTAIGTSAPELHLDWVIKNFKLEKKFNYYLSSYKLGKHKPYPHVYLEVASRLKIEPKHCIVIEDSEHGIEAGRRAGMKVIALKHPYSTKEVARADKIVKSLKEIDMKLINNLTRD